MKKESNFGLPAGEKETPQLRQRFRNYYKKHAGILDKKDRGYSLKQNNFYEFNKPEYDKKQSSEAKTRALNKKKRKENQ